ncbi:MAG TPA: NAD(P)H-dependent oxidoreductase [Baekduia sp.]|nr:NAD(P)H-dependent oxidoreductase [Baekduia sp.]
MKVLGIAGSLRAGSYNERLLRAAAELLPSGVELELWDRLGELPVYDPDLDEAGEAPEVVDDLRAALADADALLISTPEYNGTIPGGLKTVIDWGSRPRETAPLKGLPVAVVGATTGVFGAVWAQADTRRSLGIAGAKVLERELPVGQAQQAFADGEDRLADDELQAALADHVAAFVEHARGHLRPRRTAEVA